MNEMHNGMGPDDMPAQPYRVSGPPPGAPRGHGSGGWSRGKRAATLVAVCAVAGGGAFAAVQAASGSPAPAQAALTQTGTQAGSASATGQAAALRDVLTTTGPRRLARLRALGGLYGQFTYETKKGPGTLAFERGTITSLSGGDVVVRAANGTTWTWVLTGTSVVREHGSKESQGTLARGQAVFVAGPVAAGARDARLIVIRQPGATPRASSSSTS